MLSRPPRRASMPAGAFPKQEFRPSVRPARSASAERNRRWRKWRRAAPGSRGDRGPGRYVRLDRHGGLDALRRRAGDRGQRPAPGARGDRLWNASGDAGIFGVWLARSFLGATRHRDQRRWTCSTRRREELGHVGWPCRQLRVVQSTARGRGHDDAVAGSVHVRRPEPAVRVRWPRLARQRIDAGHGEWRAGGRRRDAGWRRRRPRPCAVAGAARVPGDERGL